jgi:hypothetical protein
VLAADKWMARVDADKRTVSLPRKIREDKPDDVVDRCTDGHGDALPHEVCDEVVEAYGTPRFAADEPKTDDVVDCRLKPMRREDYPVTFTDDQWAALAKAFPAGVCDYTRPGQHQHGATAWLSYQDASGGVVYGGRALGKVPTSKSG